MAIEPFIFEVAHSRVIAPQVKHIALKPPEGVDFAFIPGQFITIHFEKNGQKLRRSYSIASIREQEKTIDFAASYVAHGAGSEYLFALSPGDRVEVTGPFGRLILKDEPVRRLLLIATGTGITPYRAMLILLHEKMRAWPDLRVFIMQGVQYRHHLLYPEDFLAWAKAFPTQAVYRAYLSREDLNEQRESHEYAGYVQSSFVDLEIHPAEDIVYLCGNPNMIDQAFADLQQRGMPSAHVRREKYISSK